MTASMITPMLANALDADLEDWGPLDEATGAATSRSSGWTVTRSSSSVTGSTSSASARR